MVPEQQSHEAERALCRAGGDQVSLYAEVLSFSRLANRIFQAAGGLGEEELDAGDVYKRQIWNCSRPVTHHHGSNAHTEG